MFKRRQHHPTFGSLPGSTFWLVIAGLWVRDMITRSFLFFQNKTNMASQLFQFWRKRKFVAAAVLVELIEENDAPRHERGKTKGWIKRREEKGFFNNTVRELML